jgi:hypothetical protein
MPTKICKGCNKEKDLDDFFRLKYSHDGRQHYCKNCGSAKSAKYLKDRIPKRYVELTRICKDCKIEMDIEMFNKNCQAHNGRLPICKTCAKNRLVKNRSKTKYKPRERSNEDRESAKNKRREWHRRRHQIRKATDPIYDIKRRLKFRIHHLMKKMDCVKSQTSMKLLGCTIQFFKEWIESQFPDDMSWADRKSFHLDHVRPCASYNLLNPDEQKQCFSWMNYRPMWATENLSKGDRVDWIEIMKHRQIATDYMINYTNKIRSSNKQKIDLD